MYVMVYSTFASADAAIAVGREMVEARVAGCVNVLPTMTAIYVWKGETETANEAVLIAKLPAAGSARAVAFIKARHNYETPAILVIPLTGGNDEYLAWLTAGVGPVIDDIRQ